MAAIAAGIAFVTEDRKSEGLAIDLTNLANLESTTLPAGGWRYDGSASRRIVDRGCRRGPTRRRRSSTSAPGPCPAATSRRSWSGKWLAVKPRVLLCDEPTRGIDVGTKAEIYRLLRGLADSGVGILLASSELPEILGLADRVLVMRDGRLIAEFADGVPSEEQVMHAAAIEEAEVTA